MANSTYSFADVNITFSHPSVGKYLMNSQGAGEVNISYTDANTHKERSADGSIMTTKVVANNGTITLQMQQTSAFHKWLKAYFNTINTPGNATWNQASIIIQDPIWTQDLNNASGVAPEKRPEQPYHEQGQMVTWTFLCDLITMT